MPIDWPDHLIEQIRNSRWLLFIGAGVAATSSNGAGDSPPRWAELLERLADGLGGDEATQALEMVGRRDYLQAAELLDWAYRASGRRQDYLNKIKAAVSGPSDDRFQPGIEYDHLLDLSPRVVVTTNYDKLFEQASRDGYATLDYRQLNVASELRRGDPILLKIHGSVDALDHIVLAKRDYAHARLHGYHSFEVLRALFLTSTSLFVGYSLNDPDIQLLLEIGASGYVNPESHYVLVPDTIAPYERDRMAETLGVQCLLYPAAAPLRDVLEELAQLAKAP